MKKTLWMTTIALAFAVGGCEDKPAEPKKGDEQAAAKDTKKADDAKKAEADKKAEGATKQAKTAPGAGVDADAISTKSTELLQALKKKDVDAVVAFVAEADREDLKKQLSEGGKAHKSFFGADEWRFKAVDGWDGKIHEVRMKGDQVRVKFAEIDGKESAVVTWKKKGDEWVFDDLHSPSNDDFAAWGEKLGVEEAGADDEAADDEGKAAESEQE